MELYQEHSETHVIAIPGSGLSLSEDRDRFTMRVEAYWETYGEGPVGKQLAVASQLETVGIEPYIRKVRVTEEPQELPIGDIPRDKVGYILLVNTEGTKLVRNPSQEERADIEKRIVFFNGFEICPHGMPFYGKAAKSGPLTIHCSHGKAVVQACIYPR
jgi:hypothetical protein